MRGATGRSSPEYTSTLIVVALAILFITPLAVSVIYPSSANADQVAEDKINDLENQYYLSTGHNIAANTEIWPLSGIYTPFDGTGGYLYTPDGWIAKDKVVSFTPSQYTGTETVTARLMDNGLYYYTAVPATDREHERAEYVEASGDTPAHWDYSNASIYAKVTMSEAYKSNVFFTESNKTTTDNGFYYSYSGYRYSFSPIRPVTLENDTTGVEVQPFSTSLSLIWYSYSTTSGVAGMLSIAGSDQGLSYLVASDITRAFNSATYTAVFDMTFNHGVKMHLSIFLDPMKIAAGYTPEQAYNAGYWSVMVSSDTVATSNVNNPSHDLNIDNILNTLWDLLTFDLASDYNISGWEATLFSFCVTMPLYAALIALVLSNYYLIIGAALIAVLNTLSGLTSWWPF